MKSILISIQPKWCELIASGKKTIEVRKTRPKIETPFKVYIYQTKNEAGLKHFDQHSNKLNDFLIIRKCGTVIGEIVCDKVFPIYAQYYDHGSAERTPDKLIFTGGIDYQKLLLEACISYQELFYYTIKRDRFSYCWHISDLKIYDKPKELDMFRKPCSFSCKECGNGKGDCSTCGELNTLTRAPQSWCYVEELQ